jgi:hypothetical protein
MSDVPEWKKALQEPNSIAWIGLFILVVVIGIGALYFGGNDAAGPKPERTHATR